MPTAFVQIMLLSWLDSYRGPCHTQSKCVTSYHHQGPVGQPLPIPTSLPTVSGRHCLLVSALKTLSSNFQLPNSPRDGAACHTQPDIFVSGSWLGSFMA